MRAEVLPRGSTGIEHIERVAIASAGGWHSYLVSNGQRRRSKSCFATRGSIFIRDRWRRARSGSVSLRRRISTIRIGSFARSGAGFSSSTGWRTMNHEARGLSHLRDRIFSNPERGNQNGTMPLDQSEESPSAAKQLFYPKLPTN